MERIYKNEEVLNLTAGSYYIHDATVKRFDIYLRDYSVCIDVYFEPPNWWEVSDKIFKIHFSDIVRYQFLWANNYHFYTVERHKFFKTEQGYYLSLDPVDETITISEDDEDVILCKTIEGYFI